jgi:hypothetical protein
MSGYQDSNLGPPAPKAGALPDWATSRKNIFYQKKKAVKEGFEPSVQLPVRQFSKLVV